MSEFGPLPSKKDQSIDLKPNEEERSPEDFESAMEMMPQILSETLENYSPKELKKQPVRAEDVLQIMLISGLEVPNSWNECDEEQRRSVRNAMTDAAISFPGALVEDTPEGPVITAR